jgi:hypothetical protein
MLSGRELYRIWAPGESIWSPWVAPALFAQIFCGQAASDLALPSASAGDVPLPFDSETAIIIDLPGGESVRVALQLASIGYRPVSLINASPQPSPFVPLRAPSANIVLDMHGLVRELCAATSAVAALTLPPQAPPAFILDSQRRVGTLPVKDEMFDNRWMVFPQDFPSAQFLTNVGIRRVVLLQAGRSAPQEDLSHVLLRWQEAGITILAKRNDDPSAPTPTQVSRPSRFRSMWYRALALLGFHRSNVGGFGSLVPGDSSTG